MPDNPAANQDFARFKRRAAEQNVHEFGPTGPGHSGNSEDLSFSEDERNVSCTVACHVSGFKNHFADRHPFPLIECGGIAADHVLDQSLPGQTVDLIHADFTSVPQDRNAIGDSEDFFQVMGDVNDSKPGFFYRLNNIQEILDLDRRERRSGFVQDDYPSLEHQAFRDLHRLLFAAAEFAQFRVWTEVALQVFQNLSGLAPHFALLQQTSADNFRAGENVLHDAQRLEDDMFLIDRQDPHFHGKMGVQYDLASFKVYLASFVRLIGARKNFYQRRLAGAVFPTEAVHLVLFQIERDVLQRPDTGERL